MSETSALFSMLYVEAHSVGAAIGPVSGQVEVGYEAQEPHYVDMMFHAADNEFRTVTRVVNHAPGLPIAATITQVSEFGGMVDVSHGMLAHPIEVASDVVTQYEMVMGAVELHTGDPRRAAHMVTDMLLDVQAFQPTETP